MAIVMSMLLAVALYTYYLEAQTDRYLYHKLALEKGDECDTETESQKKTEA